MESHEQLHILREDEIELYLKGDRREIDRLILIGLNRTTSALLRHTEREKQIAACIAAMGGFEEMHKRAAFVDALIERQKKRTAAWDKIAQSTVAWALIAFLGFLGLVGWEAIVHNAKTKILG